MEGPRSISSSDYDSLLQAESMIYESLSETEQELAHAECFDQEQRAEIYSILRALQEDNDIQRKAIEELSVRLRSKGVGHA